MEHTQEHAQQPDSQAQRPGSPGAGAPAGCVPRPRAPPWARRSAGGECCPPPRRAPRRAPRRPAAAAAAAGPRPAPRGHTAGRGPASRWRLRPRARPTRSNRPSACPRQACTGRGGRGARGVPWAGVVSLSARPCMLASRARGCKQMGLQTAGCGAAAQLHALPSPHTCPRRRHTWQSAAVQAQPGCGWPAARGREASGPLSQWQPGRSPAAAPCAPPPTSRRRRATCGGWLEAQPRTISRLLHTRTEARSCCRQNRNSKKWCKPCRQAAPGRPTAAGRAHQESDSRAAWKHSSAASFSPRRAAVSAAA